MTTIAFSKSSRFYNTPQTTWFTGIYTDRGLKRDGTDVAFTLESRHNFRPDLLSYDLYGTVDYKWTFMLLNPNEIKDPIYDFVTGLSIFTASLDRLQTALGG